MNKELKPVNCGCGGEAIVSGFENLDDSISIYVCCSKCHTSTISFTGEQAEENALEVWNRAMGATDNNVGDKVKDILERNEPLSWQELKNMKGKKVWIETTKNKRWLLITGFCKHSKYYHMFTTPYVGGEAIYFSNLSRGGSIFYKTNMGKTWNAYRKERK